jgi:hypothetical protein
MAEAERNREILSGKKENQEKSRYLCDKIHLITRAHCPMKDD